MDIADRMRTDLGADTHIDWAAGRSPITDLMLTAIPGCLLDAQDRLLELIELPDDWDRHGAHKISSDTAFFASQLLCDVVGPSTPCPHIAPLSYGGVQIEWHEEGLDIEVEVVAPNKAVLSYDDQEGQIAEEDIELSTDFALVATLVMDMTSRADPIAA